MANKIYEIRDEQWDQIKDMFPKAKQADRQKITELYLTLYYGSWEAVWRGQTYPKAIWSLSNCLQSFLQTAWRCYLFAHFQNFKWRRWFWKSQYWQYLCKSRSTECGVQKNAVNAEKNQFIRVSQGDKTTKIHAIVDGLGNSVCFMFSKGKTLFLLSLLIYYQI